MHDLRIIVQRNHDTVEEARAQLDRNILRNQFDEAEAKFAKAKKENKTKTVHPRAA